MNATNTQKTNQVGQIAVSTDSVSKSFEVADGEVEVLKGITFSVNTNEFVVIFGPSGCGKSTLLHTILGLEEPTGGTVTVLGEDVFGQFDINQRADFRKRNIGMVYQQSNWVKSINVIENVALPLVLLGEDYDARMEKAKNILQAVGMLGWSEYHPSELSSGQQQKVSLARAIITDPELIIADEPTGNLDFDSGEELMGMLHTFCKKANKTILMVTHDLEYLKYADKAVKLFDGKVEKVFSPNEDEEEMQKIKVKRKYYEDVAEA